MTDPVSHVGEVLLSLTSVKGVIVSINPHWWDWPGDVPPTRVRGRIIKWVSKRADIEQLSIEWELGSGDDGYIDGQVTYTAHSGVTAARLIHSNSCDQGSRYGSGISLFIG
jgi:hypothetical protein